MRTIHNIILLFGLVILLAGCSSPNVLSEEEIEAQNAASEAVTSLLFENELDTLASYNVRKDGLVVIKFHESVKEDTYTDIVAKLRKTAGIRKVYAEQGGKEVCSIF
jgi:hypothetical protein